MKIEDMRLGMLVKLSGSFCDITYKIVLLNGYINTVDFIIDGEPDFVFEGHDPKIFSEVK